MYWGGRGPHRELRMGNEREKVGLVPNWRMALMRINPHNSSAEKGRKGWIQDPMDYKLYEDMLSSGSSGVGLSSY